MNSTKDCAFMGDGKKENLAVFIKKLLMGLVVGIAAVTPGLSGGVIAAAVGLYEPSVDAIINIRKHFKESFLFLLPLGIGGIAGVFLFSKVMQEVMKSNPFSVVYAFIGLVMGSLPSFIKESNQTGFKKRYLIATAAALGIVLATEFALPAWISDTSQLQLTTANILICGAVLSFGTIVPGVSSSFILMYMGVYTELISAIADLNFDILIILIAGYAVTSLLIIKLIQVLFKKYRGWSYYAVLGFLAGSMIMIFPGLRNGIFLLYDVFLLVFSALVCFFVMKLNTNKF